MLGPLMIDVAGTTLSAEDREVLRHPLVCGVILFARNFEHAEQLSVLCREISDLRDPRLLIAVDQEGGRVQRFRHQFTPLPPMASIGEVFDRAPEDGRELAKECAWLMASELRACGIDFSFAPVLDLQTAESRIIGNRAFHSDPNTVVTLARAYLGGIHEAGMSAVGKHFPGHGCVAADSHHELPHDTRDMMDIEHRDLIPFRALASSGIEGMMMAHIRYPNIDPDVAGYSRYWIGQILRNELRYEGVIFSDDLSMEGAAISDSYEERARLALDAGCDVLLVCNHRSAAIEVIDALDASVGSPARGPAAYSATHPATQARLIRMRSRGRAPTRDELRADSRWQEASRRLTELEMSPELYLGDDSLA